MLNQSLISQNAQGRDLKSRDLEPTDNRKKKQNKSHPCQHFGQSIYGIITQKKKHKLEPMGYIANAVLRGNS